MPKAKKITFDPVAHLKTLPQEFWLEVPTYDDLFRCEILKDFELVVVKDKHAWGGVRQKSQPKRPDACDLFPQYAEFFDKFLNASEQPYDSNFEDGKPRRDWVEYTIGDFTFRYRYRQGRCFSHPDIDGWRDCGDSYNLAYGPEMDGSAAGWHHTPEGEKLLKAYNNAEKKVANTWNRLRKKARRDAGIDLSTKDTVKAKAAEKAKKIKDETKLCADHIDAMIEALQEHKAKVLAGEITREETGYIFDMTNEMTARNAALRDALGNS